MTSVANQDFSCSLAAVCAAAILTLTTARGAAAPPACDPDNGGLKLPQGGAFIAFHGSWNRSPMPHDGYNVTFQPFAAGKPSGKGTIWRVIYTGK